jgi:hypothetical protein
LKLDFLERSEFTCPGLHMKGVPPGVLLAILADTIIDGGKLLIDDFLINFRAATVACVAVDQQEWFHFRNASHDSSGGD